MAGLAVGLAGLVHSDGRPGPGEFAGRLGVGGVVSKREIVFTVPGNPVPKARARVTLRRGGKATAYTPARTKGWEALVAQAAFLAMRGQPPLEGPVGVELWLWRGDRRRVDGDNMEKAMLDACNGVVWLDDDQVLEMHRFKVFDRDDPRVGMRVWSVTEKGLIQRGLAWAKRWLKKETGNG